MKGLLRLIIQEILTEEALGLHGAGMGEKDLKNSLGYGGIDLNKDGSVTDEEADAIAKKIADDKPERIFAYSRGAAVLSKAALDDDMPGLPPVTYVAPAALRKWTNAPVPGVPGGSITIIGDKDAAVPVKQACKIAKQAGTPLYVFPGKSHKSILYTHGELSPDAYEVDVDGCIADNELPDWGSSAQGSAEDVEKQQKIIGKYRKNKPTKDESVLREFIKNILSEEMTIPTRLRPSDSVDGELGLFAATDVPEGTPVFVWNPQVDSEYSLEYPNQLPQQEKEEFKSLASCDAEGWSMAGDNGAYFNHSKRPNVSIVPGRERPAARQRVATKDIARGEELTMDYSQIGSDVPKQN